MFKLRFAKFLGINFSVARLEKKIKRLIYSVRQKMFLILEDYKTPALVTKIKRRNAVLKQDPYT